MKRLIFTICNVAICSMAFSQAGVGTTTPQSWMDVKGSMSTATRIFSGSSSATDADQLLVFNGTSAASLTLPDATTCSGRFYWIKNASTTLPTPVLTVGGYSGQTVDGVTSWTLDEPFETVRLTSNGTQWTATAENVPNPKTSTSGGGWLQGGNKLSNIKTIGTISNYDFAFMTAGTEKMRLSSAGLLGVGTSTPVGGLHFVSSNDEFGDDYVFNDYGSSVTQGLYLRKARGTVASPANLQQGDLISQFRMAPRYNGQLTRADGSGLDAYYQGSGTNMLTDLRFFTSNTEQMRINENGNVGIGTSSFDATNPEQLKVDAGTTTSFNAISGKGTIDNYLQLNIQNNSNTANSSSDVVATAANGNESSNYIDLGINSGFYSNTSQPITGTSNNAYLYSTGNDFVIGNGTTSQSLLFFSGGLNNSNEALRITSSGNVGFGVSNPVDKVDIADDLTPSSDNSYTMGKSAARWQAVYAANGTIQTSDRRLKTHIHKLDYGMAQLKELDPVGFNWKDQQNGGDQVGLLAQEVRKIVPEVVYGDESKEHLGMNYAELVPVLIKAIKDQQATLDNLKRQLRELQH